MIRRKWKNHCARPARAGLDCIWDLRRRKCNAGVTFPAVGFARYRSTITRRVPMSRPLTVTCRK